LWSPKWALKACSTGEFQIAFIVAAAQGGILAPGPTEHDPEDAIDSDRKLAAE